MSVSQRLLKINVRKQSNKLPVEEKKTDIFSIQALVNEATKALVPVWPLETFIACNPLRGYEGLDFEDALAEAQLASNIPTNGTEMEEVNREMIKWCGAFLDMGQGSIVMPNREEGFFKGFVKLAVFDKRLHQGDKERKIWLANVPSHPEKAVWHCLNYLRVTPEKTVDFFKETFAYLPGWAGYIKWRSEWCTRSDKKDLMPVSLLDFLAVRLVLTCMLWPQAAMQKKKLKKSSFLNGALKTLEDNEMTYRHELLGKLLPHIRQEHFSSPAPDAQVVFCIDVRSEPYRRHLESLGAYQTLGFAGFFGLPVRIKDHVTEKDMDCCPVLLKPGFHVLEQPVTQDEKQINAYHDKKSRNHALQTAYNELKNNASTPFVLAEAIGLFCGLLMVFKTFYTAISSQFLKRFTAKLHPKLEHQPRLTSHGEDNNYGIPVCEQVVHAETALRLMGLTKNFAKFVIFCGHGSQTVNNPYKSALDCGACGGNHGGKNAKLLACILNQDIVKYELAKRGIAIPKETLFVAGEHNTTTDEIVFYPVQGATKHGACLDKIKKDMELAGSFNQKSRMRLLPPSINNSVRKGQERSIDWSETRPEWGLARNAAMIIAPRYVSQHTDLGGRCFLHSYDWESDTDGQYLEAILTAPMVVAQWINTQYLFSTLDNKNYGSGSKITHNVACKIGVMQGNGSDLMHGLPLQSVHIDDTKPYHTPQRLLTVVYAPRDKLTAVINRQTILKTLFFNGWVMLLAIDPIDKNAYLMDKAGNWIKYEEE